MTPVRPSGRPTPGRPRRVLAVRLDSDGDVLLTGPAVEALGTDPEGRACEVDLLVSPAGLAAARMLPGVAQVRVASVPWSGYAPPPLDPDEVDALLAWLRERDHDECVVFTSFHQSPLPMALLARMAGVRSVAATSEDYPGSLLDVRHLRAGGADGSGGGHEVLAALDLVAATGRAVPEHPRLAVRADAGESSQDRAAPGAVVGTGRYVVVHPGASVPARAPSPQVAAAAAAACAVDGWQVVLTGSPGERGLVADVAARARDLMRDSGAGRDAGVGEVVDAAGRTDLPGLARLLRAAAAVVVGNTGPAHLAAAVGTPVVSWFSPVVPAERWAPWGVPTVLLGDQQAPCALTRARECPVPGHPCLAVDPSTVVQALRSVVGAARPGPAPGITTAAPPATGAAGARGEERR